MSDQVLTWLVVGVKGFSKPVVANVTFSEYSSI